MRVQNPQGLGTQAYTYCGLFLIDRECFAKLLQKGGFTKPVGALCTHKYTYFSLFSHRNRGCFTKTLYRGPFMKPLGVFKGVHKVPIQRGFCKAPIKRELHTYISVFFPTDMGGLLCKSSGGFEGLHKTPIQNGLYMHTYIYFSLFPTDTGGTSKASMGFEGLCKAPVQRGLHKALEVLLHKAPFQRSLHTHIHTPHTFQVLFLQILGVLCTAPRSFVHMHSHLFLCSYRYGDSFSQALYRDGFIHTL